MMTMRTKRSYDDNKNVKKGSIMTTRTKKGSMTMGTKNVYDDIIRTKKGSIMIL